MVDNLNALRQIEGFPIGDDEDILALSAPPHYTAYPNPHIAEFIAQHGKPYDEATDDYHREPYVADVSEGKNDPIYNAHSYHTKVPYKAIIPFIEHYTDPGDIVFDGFAGSGMTGLAAQVSSRKAILCDLAPAATFIAANLNNRISGTTFGQLAVELIDYARTQCAWMFQTKHRDGNLGTVNYTIWSEVFECPYCRGRIVYGDVGYDWGLDEIVNRFECPGCQAKLSKTDLVRMLDHEGKTVAVPVLIDYSIGSKRYKKSPDENDWRLLEEIDQQEIPYWYPADKMMFRDGQWGDYWRAGYHSGFERVSDFYTKRSLRTLATMWAWAEQLDDRRHMRFLLTSFLAMRTSLRMPYRSGGKSAGAINNLHVPSLVQEYNPIGVAGRKSRDLRVALDVDIPRDDFVITTQSVTDLRQFPNDSIDYIFVDPPFGDNIIYGELNFLWEAWLRVWTNLETEAIVSKFYHKDGAAYRDLMLRSFQSMYRVLKPNRWITVEFHNSRASIWNIIQDSLARAGFVVAQVTIIDKQQGSYKQVSTSGAVKNDLIISAYKPRRSFETQLSAAAGVGQERAFIKHHLEMLAVTPNIERTREMLYSKVLAYYVQHGYQIQYNADQFYRLVDREFPEADGYYFRDEAQRGEYEARKLKLKQKELAQAPIFVLDERSALQWLWHFLDHPRSYSDIYTAYVKALQAREDEIPELRTLLDENFVRSNGDYRRPDVATKQELEQKRQSRLLRDFDDYLLQARAGRKLKDVRKEAVIAGFTQAYRQQRFADILTVGRKLDKKLVEASTEIFDFMDIAEAKTS